MSNDLLHKITNVILDNFVSDPEGEFLINSKWHSAKWGCDTIEHILTEIEEELYDE